MPRSSASSIASEVGAPTPTRIGAPATAAFWTSSNESRPLTQRIDRRERQHARRAAPGRPPCPSRCGGRRPRGRRASSPADVEEPGRVQAAGALEGRLGEALGQGGEQRSRETSGPGWSAAAPAPRPPPARPCRRRRRTRWCRSAARRGRGAAGRRRRPRSPPGRRVGPPRAAPSIRPSPCRKPSASSSSWPGVRIVTASGSPVDADLERLLDRDLVARRRRARPSPACGGPRVRPWD